MQISFTPSDRNDTPVGDASASDLYALLFGDPIQRSSYIQNHSRKRQETHVLLEEVAIARDASAWRILREGRGGNYRRQTEQRKHVPRQRTWPQQITDPQCERAGSCGQKERFSACDKRCAGEDDEPEWRGSTQKLRDDRILLIGISSADSFEQLTDSGESVWFADAAGAQVIFICLARTLAS